MSVPKGRRKESKFEASHHFYKLRDDVTRLVLMDFGFSKEKYQKEIERYRKMHKNDDNVEDIVSRMQWKIDTFNRWYIDEEGRAVIDLLREIEREFTVGNSIYPTDTPARLMEFLVRRWHINRAIGLCYSLKQEINYVIRTLPVDINKYEPFAMSIDEQIRLYKGVRKADNRLIKPRRDRKTGKILDTIDQNVINIFEGVASVIRKVGKIEAIVDDGSEDTATHNPEDGSL